MEQTWEYHNKELIKLKQIYQKTSKQTQNNLQEIFDSFKIDFTNLYNIADTKTKRKINTYIEECKDKGLLEEYFGVLAKNIYAKSRVKNNEILELLIYGAYIEEQSKLKETELNTFKKVVNYYYNEGIKEVNNKKHETSIIPDALFLYLLSLPNAKGYIYNDYLQAIIKYNADQIYRQAIINLAEQKELDIENDEFQNIITRQQNAKLNVKNEKVTSGDIDLTLIGLNNQAKIEGIKSIDKNAKVEFISDLCERVTPMCENMDGLIFNVNDYNEFTRYIGTSVKDVRMEKLKIYGLVVGVNLPPINNFFHWCHSTVIYKSSLDNEETKEYNVDYIRKNKYTKNKDLDTEIKNAMQILPKHIKELLEDTKFYISNIYSYYDRKNDEIYLNRNSNKYEILHEIGHVVETKYDLLHNQDYLKIQGKNIDTSQINIGSIDGYKKENEFWLEGNKFISEYQRIIYENDIDNNFKINYIDYSFNTRTLGEYFSEGFRCYFESNKLLKKKDILLYNYIKEILK